jgi:hypothetical protein
MCASPTFKNPEENGGMNLIAETAGKKVRVASRDMNFLKLFLHGNVSTTRSDKLCYKLCHFCGVDFWVSGAPRGKCQSRPSTIASSDLESLNRPLKSEVFVLGVSRRSILSHSALVLQHQTWDGLVLL